ncbi:MAG: hypothetical protein AAGH38_00435 [Pseudomonadota bacterium]
MQQLVERQINQQLAFLKTSDRLAWRRLGAVCHEISQTKFWEPQAQSFTSYVEGLATQLNCTPNTIWTAMRGVSTYQKIADDLKAAGLDGGIETLPSYVTPEILTILAKLKNLTTRENWLELSREVLSGKINRTRLRAIKSAYEEPFRELKKAKLRPHLDVETQRKNRLLFGEISNAIVRRAHKVIPSLEGNDFMMYQNVSLPGEPPLYASGVDFIYAARSQGDDVKLIGLKIFLALTKPKNAAAVFEHIGRFLDRSWLCVPKSSKYIGVLEKISGVGIIIFDEGSLTVLREAAPRELNFEEQSALAKRLLLTRKVN